MYYTLSRLTMICPVFCIRVHTYIHTHVYTGCSRKKTHEVLHTINSEPFVVKFNQYSFIKGTPERRLKQYTKYNIKCKIV